VLELACGSGQLIVPIATQGWAATGLDLSAKMLAAAQRRAAAAAVQVHYIEAEMRDFNIGRYFSFKFIARNSLLHLIEIDNFAAFFSACDAIWSRVGSWHLMLSIPVHRWFRAPVEIDFLSCERRRHCTAT
jgi:2-polyprenyl-3-methyl-5-hydroxy-6-metoxy-1,4-benzoquinol methylase